MTAATKRAILRWVHLIVTIPILGYIYQPAAEVEEYAGGVRFLFVPILMFSGYCMYAGVVFALLGVGLWVGAFYWFGFGPALLSQVVLMIGRKVWVTVRARRRGATVEPAA